MKGLYKNHKHKPSKHYIEGFPSNMLYFQSKLKSYMLNSALKIFQNHYQQYASPIFTNSG